MSAYLKRLETCLGARWLARSLQVITAIVLTEPQMKWFDEIGFAADVEDVRRLHPGMMELEEWLGMSGMVKT